VMQPRGSFLPCTVFLFKDSGPKEKCLLARGGRYAGGKTKTLKRGISLVEGKSSGKGRGKAPAREEKLNGKARVVNDTLK